MPSVSKKQHNLMALVANDPKAAKRLKIPQSVGEEFMKADKGRKFGKGGEAHAEKGEMKADIKQDKAIVKKALGMHDKQLHGGKKTNLAGLKSGGRIAPKGEHPVQKQSKRGAVMVKMAKGGLAAGHKSADGIASRGKTRGMEVKMCGGGYMKGKK